MKVIRKPEVVLINNSSVVAVEEYPHNDSDLNLAIAEISGRYPSQGFVVNEISKEMVYVLTGDILLIMRDRQVFLSAGDSVLLDKNEAFAWGGHGRIITICSPSWSVKQHKEVS